MSAIVRVLDGYKRPMRRRFADRREAGRVLARKLGRFSDELDVVALGLPRGGVPIAYEVASALGSPLDVSPYEKLGVSENEDSP